MRCLKALSLLTCSCLLAASVSAADLEGLIQQMDADKFSERKSASDELTDMGSVAIPALKEATSSSSREVAMRAFSILERHLEDGDTETKELAKAALEDLSAGEGQVARRAKEVLKPKPAPNQVAQIFGPGRIVIGAPAVARIQIRQAGGNGRRIQVRVVNGVKDITVEENGKKVRIQDDPNNGIKLEVTEKKDGKETTKKYEAKNAAELKKKHPDAYKIYEKHGKQNGGIQIRVARPAVPAVPQPQRIAQIRKTHFDRMKKNLDDQIERIEKQAEQQADGARKESYKRMIESLKRHRKTIEDLERKQLPGQAPPQKDDGQKKDEKREQKGTDSEKRDKEQASVARSVSAQ
jgi:hypothetical protein